MNPEIETEKLKIALNLQQQISNALVGDLAAARVRIRELEVSLQQLQTPPDLARQP
jgi:hypothetical protein